MTLQILPLRVRSFLSWACALFWLIGCNESDAVAVLSPGHKGLALFCTFVFRNLSPPYAWAWEPAWGESVYMSAQSCMIPCDPMDCSIPRSSVHGIFQARILEWVAISYSRGSSWSRDQTHISWVSCIGRWILYYSATWEALNGTDHIPKYVRESKQDCRLCSLHLWSYIAHWFKSMNARVTNKSSWNQKKYWIWDHKSPIQLYHINLRWPRPTQLEVGLQFPVRGWGWVMVVTAPNPSH